jgi:hypothetical protein
MGLTVCLVPIINNWKKKRKIQTHRQWSNGKDQALPMMVYIKNGSDWKYADYFPCGKYFVI